MKFSMIFMLCFALTSCGMSKHKSEKNLEEKSMTIRIECIQNQMPMSSKSSYVILDFFPADSVFHENFKIIEVVATGSKGTWNASVYDYPGFVGKDLNFVNNTARDFDPNIGGPYNFVVVVQFESGNIETFDIKNVQLTFVS